MLYSVRVGSRQAVPNKLIWFSDALLLFVVEWRQNSYLDDDDDTIYFYFRSILKDTWVTLPNRQLDTEQQRNKRKKNAIK